MRTFALILTVVVLLAGGSLGWAEGRASDADIIDYGYREAISEFEVNPPYAIRSYYAISLPDDASGIPDVITEAYGQYDRILLVEYGCYRVHPILEGEFVCIGASADGELSILPTSFDLLERTYDPASFDGVILERIY